MSTEPTHLWPSLAFRDAVTAMRFLSALGFVEHVTYRDEQDPSLVTHAEWLWPAGGGIMFGTARPTGSIRSTGGSAFYLVSEDPDGLVQKALAAGGTLHQPVIEQDYGGRSGSVLDPDGNQWSFGNYQPS